MFLAEEKQTCKKILNQGLAQGQRGYQIAEWRKKLIEHYRKTLLQVLITPLQPRGEKCDYSEIYIKPKITREIKGKKGDTMEVEVETMSEIFTKDGVPQKYIYVAGDAGSGKTSFCKYLVNCWCMAHSEEQKADNLKINDNEEFRVKLWESGGDSEESGGDSEGHRGDDEYNKDDDEEDGGNLKVHGGGHEKHRCINEEYRGDNEEHRGYNKGHRGHDEKNRGYDEENEGNDKEHRGDYEQHRSNDEKYRIDNKNHRGDNIDHRADVEEYRGDNKENRGDNKGYRVDNEVHRSESEVHSAEIEKQKADEEHGVGNFAEHHNNSDDIKDDTDCSFDSLPELESSGSEYDSEGFEQDFNGVKEMKKFEFLFYIPLRQYKNVDAIDEMLQKRYQMKILCTLLEEESSSIMILLDGLDEWYSDKVPEHSIFMEYTIVTTSRQWKFHTLRSTDVKIEQSLSLKGFDLRCEREMVYRIVSQLNVKRQNDKKARHCLKKLKEKSFESFKQLPIMLHHLICLWFDGKLDTTSRCAIYTGVLDLFFEWNDMKTTRTIPQNMKGTQRADLPQYLANSNILTLNSGFIYDVSELAYKTLFNCPKDKSLTFDISLFHELKISDELIENCLKVGIMTEDECISLSVSEPPRSLFSFIHKSMQEFLAAVNICINFKADIGLLDITGNVNFAKYCFQFIHKVFKECSTVNGILEQSNVLIMLCGLEPRLATHVSKFIYDTVSGDSRVQKYRRTICIYDIQTHLLEDFPFFTRIVDREFFVDIQNLIFESMEELNASCILGSRPVLYIGDLVIDRENQYRDIVCLSIDQKQIASDAVLSIKIDSINTTNFKFIKYLPKFHHLEKIDIAYDDKNHCCGFLSYFNIGCKHDEEIADLVAETLKVNTLTLKSLSISLLVMYFNTGCKSFLTYLPSMINLVNIRMSHIKMSHDEATTFCNFLEGTSHLEQIVLLHVKCSNCKNLHDVNLSKHQKLWNVYLDNAVNVIDAATRNLEIFIFKDLKDSNYEKIFDIIGRSKNLHKLELHGDYKSKSQLYHKNITERLVRVLPLLHNLRNLELQGCRLTYNIMQVPSEMKSLKYITLCNVKMSLTKWKKFIDSLPQTVDLSVSLCTTEDGKEFNIDMSQNLREKEINDAT